jgi:hypothetical protein
MRQAVVGLAIVCTLAVPAASATPNRVPAPKAATAAFGRFLQALRRDSRLLDVPSPYPQNAPVDCLGEVYAGSRWHEVGARANAGHGVIAFAGVFARTWVRHWWPYSHHWVAGGSPGVASVNSNAYGWGFLASGVYRLKDGAHAKILGYDGDSTGLRRFYLVRCSRAGDLIACRNALGDAMRYRPHAA